jgi:hypothetical protein
MDLSGAGCREPEARLGQPDAPGTLPAGPEVPIWQRVLLALREEDKTPTVRLLLEVIADQA